MSNIMPQEKNELLQLASSVNPSADTKLLSYLAELAASGCQAKDVKDFLRCAVARSSIVSRVASSQGAKSSPQK
jgi:hypothetical protein